MFNFRTHGAFPEVRSLPPVPDSGFGVTDPVTTKGVLRSISGCAAALADATTRSGACPGIVWLDSMRIMRARSASDPEQRAIWIRRTACVLDRKF